MASTPILVTPAPSLVTQLPDDVLQRLLAGVPLDDHRAAASTCKSFHDVIRGPRFLSVRRRYGYGFAEYDIVEVHSRDHRDRRADIRMASKTGVMATIRNCRVFYSDEQCSTTDGGSRIFVSNKGKIWAVDASSCTWKRITTSQSYENHCMEWHGGLLYVAGGEEDWMTRNRKPALDSLHAFNEATGSWEELPPIITPCKAAASCVIGNELFLAGGLGPYRMEESRALNGAFDTLQIYDIVAKTWRLGAPIPEPWSRNWNVRGLVVDGKFVVMHLKGTGWDITPATLVYDPPSDTWTSESDEPWREEFWGIDNACVHSGRLVVFTRNGVFERATDGSLSSCEDRWPEDRWHYAAFSVCESVLLG